MAIILSPATKTALLLAICSELLSLITAGPAVHPVVTDDIRMPVRRGYTYYSPTAVDFRPYQQQPASVTYANAPFNIVQPVDTRSEQFESQPDKVKTANEPRIRFPFNSRRSEPAMFIPSVPSADAFQMAHNDSVIFPSNPILKTQPELSSQARVASPAQQAPHIAAASMPVPKAESPGNNAAPASNMPSNASHTAPVDPSVNANVLQFAWHVFRHSKPLPAHGNLVISPLLLQQTLSLLQHTAAGTTREQIGNAIGHISAQQMYTLGRSIIAAPAEISRSADNDNQTKNVLDLAAAIFTDSSFSLNRTFVNEALASDVLVTPVDFGRAAETAQIVNSWARNATHSMVQQLVSADALADTVILLTNAIYFRGRWKYAFDATESGSFSVDAQLQKPVTFMKLENMLRIGNIRTARGIQTGQWVELPYEGNEFSMIAIVPTERFGIDRLIEEMSVENVNEITHQLGRDYKRNVHLRMPKFDIQSKYSLVNTLKQIGLVNLFSMGADLPFLATGLHRTVRVDDILQKAAFRCDESGSEASVAQVVNVVTLSLNITPLNARLDIDQPFVVMIVDRVNRVPLFMARINDP